MVSTFVIVLLKTKEIHKALKYLMKFYVLFYRFCKFLIFEIDGFVKEFF